jgi:hypothetical protein
VDMMSHLKAALIPSSSTVGPGCIACTKAKPTYDSPS